MFQMFSELVVSVIKLLKQLRDQGLSSKQLILFFSQLLLCASHNATPAWSSFVSKEQEGKIDAFLRRSYRCGFSRHLFTFRQIAEKADHTSRVRIRNDLLFVGWGVKLYSLTWPYLIYKYYQSYSLSISASPTYRLGGSTQHMHLRDNCHFLDIHLHCQLIRYNCTKTLLLTDACLVTLSDDFMFRFMLILCFFVIRIAVHVLISLFILTFYVCVCHA